MTAPQRKPGPNITPEAAGLIETYFARVHGAMLVSAAGEAAETVDELRAHVMDELARTDGSPAAVSRILGELGPPEALAAEYGGADGPVPGAAPQDAADPRRLHGRILGVPYELRMPTTARIASRWWNPLDPHVFVPRVFGLGWDINFGALAVKLGMVRPDDEDEPFATVPRGWMMAALAVPMALSAAVAALLALYAAAWPASVPVQWSAAGEPQSFWPRIAVIVYLLAMSVLPALGAASSYARRRPPLNRAAGAAGATLLATIALAQLVQTILTLGGTPGMWPTWVGLSTAILLPFAMLTVLSRIGRAREQRRDLNGTRKKEPAR